jgi:hypothetical protein
MPENRPSSLIYGIFRRLVAQHLSSYPSLVRTSSILPDIRFFENWLRFFIS